MNGPSTAKTAENDVAGPLLGPSSSRRKIVRPQTNGIRAQRPRGPGGASPCMDIAGDKGGGVTSAPKTCRDRTGLYNLLKDIGLYETFTIFAKAIIILNPIIRL